MIALDSLKLGITVFVVVANTILGFLVYKNNPKHLINRFFVALSWITSFWAVAMYMAPNPNFMPANLFLMRLTNFLAVPQSVLLFLLSRTLPTGQLKLNKISFYALLLLAPLVMIWNLSPFVFSDIRVIDNIPHPQVAPGIMLFAIFGTSMVTAAVFSLIKELKRVVGIKKQQIKIVLLAIIIMFGLIILTILMPVMIFHSDFFVSLSPLYILTFLALTAYAVVKHHLFDVRAFIARAVSFTALIFVISTVYIVGLFLLAKEILNLSISFPILLFATLLTIATSLTLQPLKEAIRKLTNRIFRASRYDSDRLLSQLSNIMTEVLNLDEMTDKILQLLMKQMAIPKASFFIVDNHRIISEKGIGYYNHELVGQKLESLFHRYLAERYFLFDDLEEGPVKQLFRELDVFVAIPIKVKNYEAAILILGPKLSGEIYTPQDLNLLNVFASEAGISIQNARLYSDLQEASEAKSRFISVVSHQLRTPISGIRWSLEMVRQEHLEPQEQARFLDNTYQSVIFLSEQLDDILLALDIYDKKIFLKKDSCKLNEIFKDVTEEFMGLIKSKKLVFIYDIDTGTNQVFADHGKLKKIVKTLIKNALVYSPAGGKIKISSRMEVSGNSKRVVVSINDEGIGITESEREHIFEEFFRSEKARTAFPNGLGLGMFIVQAFIRAHNGEIWFYSAGRNKGVDFHFALPME